MIALSFGTTTATPAIRPRRSPGPPSYTFDDMADDAVRVLDGYELTAAHLVGMSLGGIIAQLAALKHPARVSSLTVHQFDPVRRGHLSTCQG